VSHDCGQRFGPAHSWFPTIKRADKNWVVIPNCRRKDDEICCAGILRPMLLGKTQTEPLQSIRFRCANLVRSAHCVSELDQKRSDATHAATGDTDKMDPVMLTR
jgi:hypothetical protein